MHRAVATVTSQHSRRAGHQPAMRLAAVTRRRVSGAFDRAVVSHVTRQRVCLAVAIT